MSAATAKPPAIPPRPSRGQEKTSTSSGPMVPPRPNRRFQRSVSPNPDRFAPSPLNDTAFLKSGKSQPSFLSNSSDPIPRSTSVDLPSLGEEGKEYASLAEELSSSNEGSADPEQTRTVPEDLKLHAPKPSLPAASAKQRVMTVTRTDSERAASFGIGRPSSVEDSTPAFPSNRSLKKKASTTSQLSTASSHHDDEQGIPQIGQQVPMLKYAGDVQAPSPAPTAEGAGKHHKRRTSSRGNLPPGSYGLHGHGVVPQDKLEKAYYEKHPDLLKKEHVPHHYDRPNDFSMSRDDLDKIVKETASRGSGLGVKNYAATPSDQVGWQALEETASRIASPDHASPELKTTPIHVDEPSRPRSVMFSDTESVAAEDTERPYKAPILAEDEIAKDPSGYDHQPAVEPQVHGVEELPSSRPTSRPTSLYKETSFELRSTPLEDVEEYEPLFKDDEKQEPKKPAEEAKPKKNHHNHPHRFPSADIWEDAPSSVFYTAEVSTPELFDEQEKPAQSAAPPPREGETPAQAFARHQEELAEREARGQKNNGFLPLLPSAAKTQKPLWAQHQKHLAPETAARRPGMQPRFPSRDVWEDVPDSLTLQTTVSTPQQEEEVPSPADNIKPPELPSGRPTQAAKSSPEETKPAVPDRPKPRQASADDKPAIPERPKPQIPARPAKAGPTSGGLEPAEAAAPPPKQKPAVPARPMGSKIAALAGGFMNDLNRRLQLGPQAPPSAKKEESAEEEKVEEKEKAPLSDVRKGRARGPQRRAPASSSSAPKAAEENTDKKEVATFAFSSAVTFFEIDPDEGTVSVNTGGVSEAQPAEKSEEVVEEEEKKSGEEEEAADVAEASSVPGAFPAEEEGKKEDVPAPAPAPAETETEKEEATETKAEAKAKAEPEAEAEAESEKQETKSLATNMAGETLVSEQVKKDDEHQEVEPVKVIEN